MAGMMHICSGLVGRRVKMFNCIIRHSRWTRLTYSTVHSTELPQSDVRSTDTETTVAYKKMLADDHRYTAEITHGEANRRAMENAQLTYRDAAGGAAAAVAVVVLNMMSSSPINSISRCDQSKASLTV